MPTETCREISYHGRDTADARIRLAEIREGERNTDCNPPTFTREDRRYAKSDFAGSFTKGLAHSVANGTLTDACAYVQLCRGLSRKDVDLIANVELADDPPAGIALADPTASFAPCLIGQPSSAALEAIRPPPTLASDRRLNEAIELMILSRVRDVDLAEFVDPAPSGVSADLLKAVALMQDDLASELRQTVTRGVASGLAAPVITTGTIFRGPFPNVRNGHFLSKFVNSSDTLLPGRITPGEYILPTSGDYMTTLQTAIDRQNTAPTVNISLETAPRPVRSLRDLAYIARTGPLTGLFEIAHRAMKQAGVECNPYFCQPGNQNSLTDTMLRATWVSCVADAALKNAFFLKWRAFRTLRPEAYGIIAANEIPPGSKGIGEAGGFLLPSVVRGSELYAKAARFSGGLAETAPLTPNSCLITQAYPEGSPCHPSFPGAHAVVAGACATVLKALYDTSTAYSGSTYQIEIDKLAWNCAFACNAAGVNYYSDTVDGLLLGERIGVEFVRDQISAYQGATSSGTMKLIDFSGNKVTIAPYSLETSGKWMRYTLYAAVAVLVIAVVVLSVKLYRYKRL